MAASQTRATIEYELKWLLFGWFFPYLEFRIIFDKGGVVSKRYYFLTLNRAQKWVDQLGAEAVLV